MRRVELGFKAFDVHELLPHAVAARLGFYGEAGVAVELADITFRPDESLSWDTMQVSCGSALLSRLRGVPLTIVLVAAERPLFWLHGEETLGGARVATYPPPAPPALFLRVLLRRRGLDPDRDVRLEVGRDDAARLGLLRAGEVRAALLSSALPPDLGFPHVVAFADELQVPTTGLAVSDRLLEREPETAAAVAGALRRALAAIHDTPAVVAPIAAELFRPGAERIGRAAFTRDGTMAESVAQAAIDLIAGELGLASVPAASAYRFDPLL